MFYSITFAPAFERERRFRNDGNVEVSLGRGWGWLGQAIISNRPEIGLEKKKLENFSPKNLEIKKKSLPLQPQSRNDSDKSSLRDLHNSTSSTSIGEEIFRIDTVKEVWLWTTITDSGARIIKQFKQRRVWSWLRMNASDRLNTCKSRGSTGSNTGWRPAHGWVTRMQLTYQRGITRRKSD